MGIFRNLRKKALSKKVIGQAEPLMGKKLFGMRLPSKEMMIEGDMSYMSPIRKGGMKVNPDSPMGRRMIEEYKKRRGIGDALSRFRGDMFGDPRREGARYFGGLPFSRGDMPISDMRFRDPRFEDRGGIMNLLRSRFGERPLRLPDSLMSRPRRTDPGAILDSERRMNEKYGSDRYGNLPLMPASPLSTDTQPIPRAQAPLGIGSLPNIDIQLPAYLKNIPNFMPKFDFSNIPQLPENFQFSPQFGGMVPGFAEGMDVNAIDRSPEQMIFALDQEANILLGEAEAQARGGNLDKANEMYRQVEAINDQIAKMKGEIGDKAYVRDLLQSAGISSLLNKDNLGVVGQKVGEYFGRTQQPNAGNLGQMMGEYFAPNKPKIPGFAAGGNADMDETTVIAPRVKVSKPTGFKQSTFEFLSSDPLADEEQSQLLSALSEEGSIQEMIEALLADRGRTLSDMDIMMLSQIFSPKKSASMV